MATFIALAVAPDVVVIGISVDEHHVTGPDELHSKLGRLLELLLDKLVHNAELDLIPIRPHNHRSTKRMSSIGVRTSEHFLSGLRVDRLEIYESVLDCLEPDIRVPLDSREKPVVEPVVLSLELSDHG